MSRSACHIFKNSSGNTIDLIAMARCEKKDEHCDYMILELTAFIAICVSLHHCYNVREITREKRYKFICVSLHHCYNVREITREKRYKFICVSLHHSYNVREITREKRYKFI